MASTQQQPVSFDAIIQEGRNKRKAEQLATEIFSKNRRSSAPPVAPRSGLGGSIASRVGVQKKRPSSLTRTATPRQTARPGPLHLTRPPYNEPAPARPRPSYTQSFSGAVSDTKSNAPAPEVVTNGGTGISFKGAASGPYGVVAQNFAPGTTAADIESVMQNVGGDMTSCRILASNPTVIAEMMFVERAGAEKVIETFNGKKADGRPLYVFWRTGGHNTSGSRPAPPPVELEPQVLVDDEIMEVDEVGEPRETEDRLRENRLREERRSRDTRAPRDAFPTGPRSQNQRSGGDSYYRSSDRRDGNYQDGRYGYGGGYGRGGGPGRYTRGQEQNIGRGRSWRP
ncbi:uncharacterized protein LTR77_005338 [Saxophila tyrrhenica]|uniref:RRM domain-containing protein n=1 Tax=Saxophila tyrrhenica TaxID=1690608 RepID=A0AAV9P8M4_9PEZI|nr:hypothetical protein LTR77_005338 [Saxophila tyrrhenica]